MDFLYLWEKAEKKEVLSLEELDEVLSDCLTHGDQVFDHYGGKPPFLILEYRGSRLLTLELLPDGNVAVTSIVNATGGYGTGILGGEITILSESLLTGLASCCCTNDEYGSLERYTLAKKVKGMIAEHTGSIADEWEITFTSTGTEAMDFAYQIVQLEKFDLLSGTNERNQRDVIIACRGAWHGWSLAPNQLLDRRQFTEGLPRFAGFEVVFHQYGEIEQLEEIFSSYAGRIRGIFVEGILGDGGVVVGSGDWWNRLFTLAEQEDARIIDDEILTCMRTGNFLALPKGKAPDCITLGKGLGFGVFPISAVAWKKKVLSPRAGIGVRTFNARPLQSQVVEKGLTYILEKDLFARSRDLGKKLLGLLKPLPSLYPDVYKDVRGKGFLIGIELADSYGRRGRQVRDELIRSGLLTELESGLTSFQIPRNKRINQTIRLTPPLTIPEEDFESILTSFLEVGKKLSKKAAVHV